MIVGGIINIRSFSVTNKMCNLVSSGVGPFYVISFGFFILNLDFRILGALVGSTSFVESFVAEALHEDFESIFNLRMFTDL